MIEYFLDNNVLSEWDFGGKWKFKFNTFDIEDEKSKMDLFEKQINTGLKTINEIRLDEGMEELDEEDLPGFNDDAQVVGDEDLDKQRKPGDPDPEESKKKEEKKSGPTLDNVINQFIKGLKQGKKKLLQEIRNNGEDRLTQVKSFSSIISGLTSLFDVKGMKNLISVVTNFLFTEGITETEVMIKAQGVDVNSVSSSPDKVTFLSGMAFDNIKGVSEDLRVKLTQQLKMGISQGEGIGTLSQRVEKAFDVSEARAETIARTEAVRIKSQGQMHAAEQIAADGVNLKKWLLWVNDSRTSNLTKALHSKYGSESQAIPIDKNFNIEFQGKSISQNAPPFHPNERDTLMTLIVDKGDNNGRQ